jgi:hypothetical protein
VLALFAGILEGALVSEAAVEDLDHVRCRTQLARSSPGLGGVSPPPMVQRQDALNTHLPYSPTGRPSGRFVASGVRAALFRSRPGRGPTAYSFDAPLGNTNVDDCTLVTLLWPCLRNVPACCPCLTISPCSRSTVVSAGASGSE